MTSQTDEWVPISREELDHGIRPWLGRRNRAWLEQRVRPWPHDSSAVLVPKTLYEEYRRRPKMSPLTEEQKERLGLR